MSEDNLKLHKCQKFPDTEYWVEDKSGVWKIKPKKNWDYAVTILLKVRFNIPVLNNVAW